jgi:hypothetical protein
LRDDAEEEGEEEEEDEEAACREEVCLHQIRIKSRASFEQVFWRAAKILG